jgi:glutamate 5-kinase
MRHPAAPISGFDEVASVSRSTLLCRTWFLTGSSVTREKWSAGSLEPRGALHVEAEAAKASANGKSLLPAGVTRVEGNFTSGDCVLIRDAHAAEIGRGLVGYDASEAVLIVGRNSQDILSLLGTPGRAAIVHRDDMVVASGQLAATAGVTNGKS